MVLLANLAHVRRVALLMMTTIRISCDHDAHPDKMSGVYNDLSVVYMHQISQIWCNMRGKNLFKRSDMRRAIDTARKAGLAIETVRIGRDGAIEVKVVRDGTAPTAPANEWDEAARQ
jgi:hypothetical protein